MDTNSIFFGSILLFAIIYFAVAAAIKPLLHKQDDVETYKQEGGLLKLRNIGVLNPHEFKDVVDLYQKKGANKQAYEEYGKYAKVLSELKEMGYFTDEDYSCKMDKLKEYFKIG